MKQILEYFRNNITRFTKERLDEIMQYFSKRDDNRTKDSRAKLLAEYIYYSISTKETVYSMKYIDV